MLTETARRSQILRRVADKIARVRDRIVGRWRYVAEHAERADWETSYATGAWDRLRGREQLAHYSQIVGYCNYFKSGGSILDVGCGEGVVQEKLRPYGYRRYVGIDLADAAIRAAAEKEDQHTRFVRADATEYETDERFDVIVFNECLYYFADPIGLMEKYERFLCDGGLFVVSMYGVERSERLWDLLAERYSSVDGVRVLHDSGKSWTVKVVHPNRNWSNG